MVSRTKKNLNKKIIKKIINKNLKYNHYPDSRLQSKNILHIHT